MGGLQSHLMDEKEGWTQSSEAAGRPRAHLLTGPWALLPAGPPLCRCTSLGHTPESSLEAKAAFPAPGMACTVLACSCFPRCGLGQGFVPFGKS